MTICIAIKVPDGLVFAADSMSSYTVWNPATQEWDVTQSYNYANKLIQFGRSTIGVLVWGQGSIQKRSIENLVEEFSRQHLPQSPLVHDTAVEFRNYIQTIYELDYPDPATRPISGFLVGGYDVSHPFGQLWAFEFPFTPNPTQLLADAAVPSFGVQWFGQTDALIRLINGFDLKLVQVLKAAGLDAATVDGTFTAASLNSAHIPYNIIFDGMPLQDAVDFAAYLAMVVKGRFRFVVGPKVCGGPVDIAVIKSDRFDWIKRKTVLHFADI